MSVATYRFGSAAEILADLAELLRPPRRVTVSESAQENVRVAMPGGHYGPWSPTVTPYMVEPMDALTARELDAVVFVGPSRAGKTQALLDCWIAHAVLNDPGDFMVVHMSQDMARDYSLSRVDRLHENSPAIGQMIALGSQSDNVHDKVYRHGMILRIAWPTTKQLAARDIRYVALTDLDGMPQEIGPEKSTPFGLAQQRTLTFMSSGMTLAESSPRFDWPDPDWEPQTRHELPQAKGICSLYNLGDRRVLYFQCPSCRGWFVPDFPEAFSWDDTDDIEAAAESARFVCTECGDTHAPAAKRAFLEGARWVPDGCTLDEHGQVEGTARRSNIASFRLPAGAAAFQPPSRLVRIWLRALRDYELTGDETSLRETTFKDHGRPYKPKVLGRRRSASQLRGREKVSGFERGSVPDGVRFLTISWDVQAYRFAVAVIGWGEGLQRWVIDRFDLKQSRRLIPGGQGYEVIEPAAFDEDWDVLGDLLHMRYPLADGSGRGMACRLLVGDSGGMAGVTQRAYNFWRRCAKRGVSNRLMLVKGGSGRGTPRVQISYPDSQRKDRKAKARGEVPVAVLNTDLLKDGVSNDLDREVVGPGFVHFARGLPDSTYDEIAAETRDDKGRWVRTGKVANETLDLLVYARAGVVLLNAERSEFWAAPPIWASEWDTNPLVARMDDPPPAPNSSTRRGLRRRGRRVVGGVR